MPQELNIDIEDWETSPVIRPVGRDYERWPADRYNDAPDRRWFWTITARVSQGVYDRGYVASREQAMADFKAQWRVVN